MNGKFRPYVEDLERKLQELLSMKPVTPLSLPRGMPKAGVYLFSEGDAHLYVGRSKQLKQRIQRHSHKKEATFSFRLARDETGYVEPSYKPKDSRYDLLNKPEFQEALRSAMARIQKMEVRFVEEPDPIKQALLEIYVAVVLETPHNSFATS